VWIRAPPTNGYPRLHENLKVLIPDCGGLALGFS
jgi:hypothetical protein